MKFRNIERNILYLLIDKCKNPLIHVPLYANFIFDTFSDIPAKAIKDALWSLKEKGFVELTHNYRSISLTEKGLSKAKSLFCLNMPNHQFPESSKKCIISTNP